MAQFVDEYLISGMRTWAIHQGEVHINDPDKKALITERAERRRFKRPLTLDQMWIKSEEVYLEMGRAL